MAEGRSRERWAHTSTAVWVVAEVNRNKKKRSRPFTPHNFNPYERKASGGGKPLTVGTLLAMRAAFEQGAKS